MKIKNKTGAKAITKDIEDNFERILDEVSNLQPDQKERRKTASSLIMNHKDKIQKLLNMGYSAEQIVEQLAQKINLNLSPETLRSVLRKANNDCANENINTK
jgi:Holliday junction resolvasome RuvABC DNA-binding subunit